MFNCFKKKPKATLESLEKIAFTVKHRLSPDERDRLFNEGKNAFRNETTSPYDKNSDEFQYWFDGYCFVAKDREAMETWNTRFCYH
jgi:hypothetical protein